MFGHFFVMSCRDEYIKWLSKGWVGDFEDPDVYGFFGR